MIVLAIGTFTLYLLACEMMDSSPQLDITVSSTIRHAISHRLLVNIFQEH